MGKFPVPMPPPGEMLRRRQAEMVRQRKRTEGLCFLFLTAAFFVLIFSRVLMIHRNQGLGMFPTAADGDLVLVYQARANEFANPGADGTIVNTVTAIGDGLANPATATETITGATAPLLTITKSISPAQVVDNDRVTYTFLIQNTGNEAVVATDNAAITDTFNPILTDLVVTFNGVTWTEGVQYNYNEATGLFSTVPSQITVPAATYTQDPVTGAYTLTPGIATLVVTGTI